MDAAIGAMIDAGTIEREAGLLRLAGHRVSFDADDVDVQRLLAAIGGENTAAPPTISELGRAGVGRGVIDAAVAAGLAVRVSSDLVFVPEVVARAEALVRAATEGITVSTFREKLGTSRKYALPLLEHFDRAGVSRRDGDLRFPR